MRSLLFACPIAGMLLASTPAAATGMATLEGEIALTAMGGEAVKCAGGEVLLAAPPLVGALAPATPEPYRSRCDQQGHFSFTAVPPGPWIISARVIWQAPAKHGFLLHGGWVRRALVLHAGANTVALGDADFP